MKNVVIKSTDAKNKETVDAKSFYETRSFLVFSLGIFISLNVATTFIVSIYMANSSGAWLWVFASLVFVDVLVCVYLILAFIKMPNPILNKKQSGADLEGKDTVKDILDADEEKKLKIKKAKTEKVTLKAPKSKKEATAKPKSSTPVKKSTTKKPVAKKAGESPKKTTTPKTKK